MSARASSVVSMVALGGRPNLLARVGRRTDVGVASRRRGSRGPGVVVRASGDGNPLEAAQEFFGGLFKEKDDPVPVGANVAPFSLPSTTGSTTTVPDGSFKCAVVFFFPKSDTPGCKAEGDRFDAQASTFQAKGAQVVGVSMETVDDLQASNSGRDIELLSDAEGAVSKAFDAELSLVVAKFSARKTFLLSPSGEVLAKWSEGKNMADVKDGSHAMEVLAAIDSLA